MVELMGNTYEVYRNEVNNIIEVRLLDIEPMTGELATKRKFKVTGTAALAWLDLTAEQIVILLYNNDAL